MEATRKRDCLLCFRTFYALPLTKVYCSIRCNRKAKDRRKAAAKKLLKGDTLLQRKEKLRYETERVRDYSVGDVVRFRGKKGKIILKLPAGSSIPLAWQEILAKDPELLPAANSTFASIRATTTVRFFILCEAHGKRRVHCPYLHNIMEKEE